jgi:hypothetical protein
MQYAIYVDIVWYGYTPNLEELGFELIYKEHIGRKSESL